MGGGVINCREANLELDNSDSTIPCIFIAYLKQKPSEGCEKYVNFVKRQRFGMHYFYSNLYVHESYIHELSGMNVYTALNPLPFP